MPKGRPALDLTNHTFGRLTALYRLEQADKTQGHRWMCLCECGNYTDVGASTLTRGAVQSCGCLRTEAHAVQNEKRLAAGRARRERDFPVGRVFGRLTIVSEEDYRYKHGVKKLCRCECGNYKQVPVGPLWTGKSQSCGCINAEKSRDKLADYWAEVKGETD